jgi:hypothetical protein
MMVSIQISVFYYWISVYFKVCRFIVDIESVDISSTFPTFLNTFTELWSTSYLKWTYDSSIRFFIFKFVSSSDILDKVFTFLKSLSSAENKNYKLLNNFSQLDV